MRENRIVDEITSRWILDEIGLPIKLSEGRETRIFELLNNLLYMRHNRKELLLPNFKDAETVLIFSDCGGEASTSKY